MITKCQRSWVPARASRCASEYEKCRREQVTESQARAPSPHPGAGIPAHLGLHPRVYSSSQARKRTHKSNGFFPGFSSLFVTTAPQTPAAPQKQHQSAPRVRCPRPGAAGRCGSHSLTVRLPWAPTSTYIYISRSIIDARINNREFSYIIKTVKSANTEK